MTVPAVVLSEKAWQQLVVDYARLHGWWVHHHFDSRRSEPGLPDLICVRDGEGLFAELKRESGKVTAVQAYVLDLFESAGWETHVWRPSDEDAAFARLSRKRSA